MKTMPYRSISFQQGYPNPDLLRLGARLGFNDICFQTEGGLLKPLKALRYRADRSGYFALAGELNMTVSLWVHEFADYDATWGAPAPDNDVLWNALSDRYDMILGDLFPEVNNLVLTVVETQIRATDPQVLPRLVTTLQDACKRHGRSFILRSFVHHPGELSEVTEAIGRLPSDVTIMTKSVPQDWHLRSVDDPLIGKVGGRTQYIEVDIAGEYFRMDHVANCFVDTLAAQYQRWVEAGCSGISVRVDRGWKPHERQNVVLDQAQEANLWLLGMLSTGAATTAEQALEAYTVAAFGEAAAPAMARALRPTGNVVAEGLYVLDEPFGESKYQHAHPLSKLAEGETAVAYEDEDDQLRGNPFHMAWSVFRWDPNHVAEYHQIRRGHPEVIARKEKSYAEALASARESLRHIESVADELPKGAYEYFRFRLEENEWQVQFYCEIQLAWLKLSCRLYGLAGEHDRELRDAAGRHLAKAEELAAQCRFETITCQWRGRVYHCRRGQYVDIRGFMDRFREYWGDALET